MQLGQGIIKIEVANAIVWNTVYVFRISRSTRKTVNEKIDYVKLLL